MTYEEQLKDQRWLDLREIILIRDGYMCQHCMSGKNLQVHHLYYLSGKLAWEYPDSALQTLCKGCHAMEHGIIKVEPKRIGNNHDIKTIRMVMIEFIQSQINRLNK
jgi:5-methylcytosine-specific restriction endonuclease McrA